MNSKLMVKYTLESIASVKARAAIAQQEGDIATYNDLMGDLLYLECSLVGDAQKLIEELDKKIA